MAAIGQLSSYRTQLGSPAAQPGCRGLCKVRCSGIACCSALLQADGLQDDGCNVCFVTMSVSCPQSLRILKLQHSAAPVPARLRSGLTCRGELNMCRVCLAPAAMLRCQPPKAAATVADFTGLTAAALRTREHQRHVTVALLTRRHLGAAAAESAAAVAEPPSQSVVATAGVRVDRKGKDLWNDSYYPTGEDSKAVGKPWYIIDAKGQTLGRLACLAAHHIRYLRPSFFSFPFFILVLLSSLTPRARRWGAWPASQPSTSGAARCSWTCAGSCDAAQLG